jgi:hypothetical protein
LMHVVMGPLGGANALRAVLMRLRNIPVFIPGAAGGLGGFVRVAKAAHTATVWSSKRLAKALIRAGKVRPDGADAHHIVAGGHEWAEPARKVLAKVGIKLDEAVNGVFLPATKNSPNPLGSQVHRPLSNIEAYYKKVNSALEGLTTRKAVEAKLQEIAQQLTNGTFL